MIYQEQDYEVLKGTRYFEVISFIAAFIGFISFVYYVLYYN